MSCQNGNNATSNKSLMFNFELPSHTRSYFNESGEIKFDPPVYEQRYAMSLRILEHELFEDHIKSVVDFGTSEMALIPMIKQIDFIEKVVAVDIDRKVLETHLDRAKPFLSDHIKTRPKPFTVEVYEGSISEPDPNVVGIDAVLAIEIIEHVFPVTLNDIPYSIFGVIQPKIALISTPNSEFNVLFDLPLENGFRHYDHKFEWTRRQFKDWSFNICERFPNYLVCFLGAGVAPPDYLKLGPVTQIALFVRKDILDMELVEPLSQDVPTKMNYKLVHKELFPFNVDERSKEEKILDEAKYHIHRLRRLDMYINQDKGIAQIPVIAVYEFLDNLVNTSSELVKVLQNNDFEVQDEFIIIELEEEEDDDLRRYGSMGSLGSLYDYETYDYDRNDDFDDNNMDEAAGGAAVDKVMEDFDKLNIEESWD